MNEINDKLKSVKTVIFTYSGNPQITNPAPGNNELPQIISFGKLELMEKNGVKEKSYPNPQPKPYNVTHEHKYIQYCNVMDPAFKFYVAALCLWVFGTIFHIFWTWCVRKDYSTHLQKIILFVPIYFLAYTLIDYVYYMS